ncbi:MAG TPA: DUF222 domain-containing protein [Aeromicrobium sp.]|nr:DUF222 domain-containing protein [Aeromicrobium sp.]
MFSGSDTTLAVMRDAARTLQSPTASLGDEVRAMDRAEKALAMAKAAKLAEMDALRAHESEGAASITVWARREIQQDAGATRAQVRSINTTRTMHQVREAAAEGRIGMRHLQSFAYAIAHCGAGQVFLRETEMVDAAMNSTPKDFHERVRHLRFRLFPDDLDQAYLDGMARRDFKLSKTLGGWHLTGFLDIEVGAMLDTVLRNLSVPRDAGDDRTPADRRMDGLEQLLKSTLEHGLPSDNGIRPQLSVVITAETLKAIAKGDRPTIGELEPAVLQGFGPIGPVLLSVLLDDGQITPILVKDIEPNPEVLDVGRTHRRATPRQARAIAFRQNGICASPGCHHPIAHNHHRHWFSNGGRTALEDMDGRCTKCHTLIHAGRLNIPGYTKDGWPLRQPRRRRTG